MIFKKERVLRVIDGDTFILASGEHVRLIGINSREYEPWKNFVQPCGREACDFAKKLLTGKTVSLERDEEPKDKYGRTLAYAYLDDGRMVNEILTREGYAEARTYKPNVRYREIFKTAAQEAKKNKAGCIE